VPKERFATIVHDLGKRLFSYEVAFGQNLFGQNLIGQNLFGQNLFGQNLYGLNLFGQNLYGLNLFGQNFFSNKRLSVLHFPMHFTFCSILVWCVYAKPGRMWNEEENPNFFVAGKNQKFIGKPSTVTVPPFLIWHSEIFFFRVLWWRRSTHFSAFKLGNVRHIF
jgi:hypothetical protein